MTVIKLNHICKVEGHAKLHLNIERGKVKTCELAVTEGARFFEGLLKGKHYSDAKEITSRICGICSCGHVVASLKATEAAFGLEVSKQTDVLRELLTMGERIRSHATHMYLLALPDYLGYDSAIAMAAKYKTEVSRALKIVGVGNKMVETVGGREMHPVSPVVGGFTHVINKKEQGFLIDQLHSIRKDCEKSAELFLSLDYPRFEHDIENISLLQQEKFPLIHGIIISNRGVSFEPQDYKKFIAEHINHYSNAKFATRDGKGYRTNALARVNLNYELLGNKEKEMVSKSKYSFPSVNPFLNNAAQGLELMHWTDRAIEMLEGFEFGPEEVLKPSVGEGRGVGVVEVPRGILIHDYTHDKKGFIKRANIITPTVQMLQGMQDGITLYVEHLLREKSMTNEKLVLEIEKLIRAHDPCFSCSCHFLEVDWS